MGGVEGGDNTRTAFLQTPAPPPPNVFSPEYVMYRNPSPSLCSSYTSAMRAAVGGSTALTNMKTAFSGATLTRLRMT